ncbi:hypothetical protein D6821_02845 [Candidatus Parcubacteria bacterium]|nr:MAG: hypothetical protein D6821_02845 [Candidatus Parcubacteria bacterium]
MANLAILCYNLNKEIIIFADSMTKSVGWYSSQLIKETIGSFLFFPSWWYTVGLWQVINGLQNFLAEQEKALALRVWIKNIFRPMYGQRDWQGIAISIVMRIIQIILRSIVMALWTALALVLLGVWIILPLLIFYQIFLHLGWFRLPPLSLSPFL